MQNYNIKFNMHKPQKSLNNASEKLCSNDLLKILYFKMWLGMTKLVNSY